jgi:uncharacterized protein (TIGR00661 family)
MNKKTFLLAVQGEGRGHLTQAMAVYDILRKTGMDVCCVLVGSSSQRVLPDFFIRNTGVPMVRVSSPNFVKDAAQKSIRPGKTFRRNLLKVGSYRKSILIIRRLVTFHRPDVIINFYEPLIGVYARLYGPPCRILSVAHQYLYLHPAFEFPGNRWLEKAMIRFYTRLTAWGASRILALSFYEMPASRKSLLTVMPPLLRHKILQCHQTAGDYLLVYLLNCGYMDEILQWHLKHPEIRIHCFTDSPKVRDEMQGEWKVDDSLTWHALDDKKFMDMMAGCRALATTAGFESVCEAMYLGKPVLMVPVSGHYEQWCNARDAARAGAGIHAERFDLDKLLQYLEIHTERQKDFRQWVLTAEQVLIGAIASLYPDEQPANEKPEPDLLKRTG